MNFDRKIRQIEQCAVAGKVNIIFLVEIAGCSGQNHHHGREKLVKEADFEEPRMGVRLSANVIVISRD